MTSSVETVLSSCRVTSYDALNRNLTLCSTFLYLLSAFDDGEGLRNIELCIQPIQLLTKYDFITLSHHECFKSYNQSTLLNYLAIRKCSGISRYSRYSDGLVQLTEWIIL
jgi:hypothetical protein